MGKNVLENGRKNNFTIITVVSLLFQWAFHGYLPEITMLRNVQKLAALSLLETVRQSFVIEIRANSYKKLCETFQENMINCERILFNTHL